MFDMPPIVALIVYVSLGLIALAIGWRIFAALFSAGRRRHVHSAVVASQRELEQQVAERKRHAAKIIATSSTGSIVGYTIVRQIEACFVDGHKTPAQASEALKALAGLKGGNAVINMVGERVPNSGCTAHGDAVIVRSDVDSEPDKPDPPSPPGD